MMSHESSNAVVFLCSCIQQAGDAVLTYDNCEPLSDELQVSWTVDQTEDRVFFQLCGCVDAGDYMAFGLSESAVQMVGADAVVTWHDSEGTGAVDYYLSARAQVSGAMPCVINIYICTYISYRPIPCDVRICA